MRWPWSRTPDPLVAALEAENARLHRENEALLARLVQKDAHYAALVERIAAPVPPPPRPVVESDPTLRAIESLRDETIDRMAADFIENGMEPELARQHARELAQQAEAVWGG